MDIWTPQELRYVKELSFADFYELFFGLPVYKSTILDYTEYLRVQEMEECICS